MASSESHPKQALCFPAALLNTPDIQGSSAENIQGSCSIITFFHILVSYSSFVVMSFNVKKDSGRLCFVQDWGSEY